MPSTLIQRGLAMAARALPAVAGGAVVYSRGANSVELSAGFGKTDFQVETADAVRIEHTDRDFIFAAADLILGGTVATPQRGDRIEVIDEEETFEVLAPSGAQVYRSCDAEGLMIRVHTKRVAVNHTL